MSPALGCCCQWLNKTAHLRDSHIWLMLSVVEQDIGLSVGFQDSSDLSCISRLSTPDKPVPTAPRLVTRVLELMQTIEEGC